MNAYCRVFKNVYVLHIHIWTVFVFILQCNCESQMLELMVEWIDNRCVKWKISYFNQLYHLSTVFNISFKKAKKKMSSIIFHFCTVTKPFIKIIWRVKCLMGLIEVRSNYPFHKKISKPCNIFKSSARQHACEYYICQTCECPVWNYLFSKS